MNASFWIDKLKLLPHPEGGFYRETYRSGEIINNVNGDERNVSTAIYFLLEGEDKSHFHRIRSDELWFFHQGQALEILVLNGSGLSKILLGPDAENGEHFQARINAGDWFAARLKDGRGYALVSCTVAPGFDFNDFELAKADVLSQQFSEHSGIIREMSL